MPMLRHEHRARGLVGEDMANAVAVQPSAALRVEMRDAIH
jgi:hypothetical protein